MSSKLSNRELFLLMALHIHDLVKKLTVKLKGDDRSHCNVAEKCSLRVFC